MEVAYYWTSVLTADIYMPRLAVLCLILSPMAGAISWLLARTQGLNGKGYAFRGTVYSVLFMGPWLYITLQLVGKTSPRWTISLSYVLLYLVWSTPIYSSISIRSGYAASSLEETTYNVLGVAFLALLLVSLLVLLHSRRIRRHQGSDVLPTLGNIFPFVGLWLSMAAYSAASLAFGRFVWPFPLTIF